MYGRKWNLCMPLTSFRSRERLSFRTSYFVFFDMQLCFLCFLCFCFSCDFVGLDLHLWIKTGFFVSRDPKIYFDRGFWWWQKRLMTTHGQYYHESKINLETKMYRGNCQNIRVLAENCKYRHFSSGFLYTENVILNIYLRHFPALFLSLSLSLSLFC